MKEQALIPTTAAEWFLALQATQDMPADMLQAWLRWFESSEDNRKAFEEIAQVWHATPSAMIARRAASPAKDNYDGSVPVSQWRARQSQSVGWRKSKRSVPTWLAAAAGVGAVAVLAVQYFSPAPIAHGQFVTATGQHRSLVLADGSRVTLGGASRLSVDIQAGMRTLRLQSGEAYFDVHKDPQRPFVVFAMQGAVTAVGTAFNVRAVKNRVTVTVTDGVVRVAEAASKAPSSTPSALKTGSTLRLARGEQMSYQPGEVQQALAAGDIKRVDAEQSARWRKGWLVYRDEPLKYVVADIARYSQLKLTLAPGAQDLKFSGAVFKDNIPEWIAALPEVSPVVVGQSEEGFVIDARLANSPLSERVGQ